MTCPTAGDPALRDAFIPTWQRYDEAITTGRAIRSWIWGPESHSFAQEAYQEAAGGCRTVLYWDKSRMEITNPGASRTDKYFVTNGLLARELVSGQIQVGQNKTVQAPNGPAQIPVAGDSLNNPNAPTYAAFASVTTVNATDHLALNRGTALIDQTLDKTGTPGTDTAFDKYNVRLAYYADQTHHNIPDVFWTYMNSRGPIKVNGEWQDGDTVDWLYSMGLPLSEPYWTRVKVGGVEQDVLTQIFERRVLTYTPANPDGFKVEMGNIGLHYHLWRYRN